MKDEKHKTGNTGRGVSDLNCLLAPREIKFRAWDKVLNEFLPNVQNHINDEEWAFGSMLKNDRWIIQQFTGLKDKNGREIYEGDIIKFNDSFYPVAWETDLAMFELIGEKSQVFENWNNKQMKVVGNIFETPELLE